MAYVLLAGILPAWLGAMAVWFRLGERAAAKKRTENTLAYILAVRAGRFWLIGPFANSPEAAAWGHDNNPHDDPRWNTIQLAWVPAGMRLVSPAVGPMEK